MKDKLRDIPASPVFEDEIDLGVGCRGIHICDPETGEPHTVLTMKSWERKETDNAR